MQEKNNAIVHFEIPADDVQRAMEFYKDIFDWKFHEFEMPKDSSTGGESYYGVITTDVDDKGMATTPGAINGGLMKRSAPGQVFANYIQVDDVAPVLEKVTAQGGNVVMPKTEIAPGMGWIALFKDPEGNIMGLHQMGEAAKS